MNTEELISKLGKLGERELLIEATVHYLVSLPPELADAAFRSAILRWFNPKALEAVLGVGAVSGIESIAPDRKTPSKELYDQLRKLRFAEEYPGRGYSFHDLTREFVLTYLWEKDLDFYRKVSNQASTYFGGLLNTQIAQSKRGEIDPSEVDWDLGVEQAYHSIVGDEQQAIEGIGAILDFLLRQRKLGTYHAVVQAVSEHAEAGRMSPDSQASIKLWRLREALANYDIAGLGDMASEILQAPDSSAPRWLKVEATYLLAEGLRLASRYDEAENYLQQHMDQCKELEDPNSVLRTRALEELGLVEFNRENYDMAGKYFSDALELHVQKLRVPVQEDSQFKEDTPLRVVDPAAWHRRELYPADEDQDPQEGSSHTGDEDEIPQEEEPQVLILYFIEFNTTKLGIDTAGLSEDEALGYQWPVEFDDVLAELWLNFGYLERARDHYDSAAACARLAGQMYVDLANLAGAQAAVQLLGLLGANLGDLETVKSMGEFEQELVSAAVARRDERVVLSSLISQASSQFDMGNYEEARATYEKAYSLAESLDLGNEKATCLDGFARLWWIEGEYDKAAESFHNASELYEQVQNREGWADSLLSLGELHVARNQLVEAEQCYLRALYTYEELQTLSGRFNSLVKLSEVAKTKGDYDGSFAHLDQALQLSRSRKDTRLSSEAVALSNIADLHLSLGHIDQAQVTYDQALGISDRIGNKQLSAAILLDRANVLSDMAEYASAVQVYDQVIERDPNNSSAYSGKAWALQTLGKDKAQEARQAYEKSSELRPNDWWAHKGIADALRLSGDNQAATIKYQWIVDQIRAKGVQSPVRDPLAWCYYQLGECEKADNLLKEVVNSNPDSIPDYFDFGLVLLCRQQYSEALEAYEQGIASLQHRYPPLLRLGLIYVAIDDLHQAIEVHPKLLDAGEYNRILGLLSEQWELVRERPDSKLNGDKRRY
jgi:tetratricopeptide (TPR) repeat protein